MKVALGISSFRQNEAVCALLDRAFGDVSDIFSHVFVVESQGDGGVEAYCAERGYDVTVVNAEQNLGSAGNLALRLKLAAETDADWMLALNHDGELVRSTVLAFMEAARVHSKAGALYPLRKVPARHKIDITGRRRLPLPFIGVKTADKLEAYTAVRWGSSNGAFYNLTPLRAGLHPPDEFWMGWEDLQYGWLLDRHGWPQYVVRDAVFIDDREYLHRKVIGINVTISDKPSWYAYYFARNFVLIAREEQRTPLEQATIAARIALETASTLVFKPNPIERIGFLATGVVDGFKGRTGKWIHPS